MSKCFPPNTSFLPVSCQICHGLALLCATHRKKSRTRHIDSCTICKCRSLPNLTLICKFYVGNGFIAAKLTLKTSMISRAKVEPASRTFAPCTDWPRPGERLARSAGVSRPKTGGESVGVSRPYPLYRYPLQSLLGPLRSLLSPLRSLLAAPAAVHSRER